LWKVGRKKGKSSRDSTTENPQPLLPDFSLFLVSKLHQSSIKSLDIRTTCEGGRKRWLVGTGGDDNALALVDLALDTERREIKLVRSFRISHAHAAAITGLRMVVQEDAGLLCVTVSNDQRIKKWRIQTIGGHGADISLLEDQYCAVADAGALDVLPKGELMVGGVGMEVRTS
jgi:hypothetical protein